ncbi:MAG: hypothetical protein Q9219_004840 [cf. Caloplaca sp. 3 TL-2023]
MEGLISSTVGLYTLGALGFYGTWGRAFIDGTIQRLINALHGSELHLMTGTEEPLRTTITGLYWPVDYFLNVLILFFWEAVDGSHPTTSLVAFYFAGQHLSIVVAQYVHSYRRGSLANWKLG